MNMLNKADKRDTCTEVSYDTNYYINLENQSLNTNNDKKCIGEDLHQSRRSLRLKIGRKCSDFINNSALTCEEDISKQFLPSCSSSSTYQPPIHPKINTLILKQHQHQCKGSIPEDPLINIPNNLYLCEICNLACKTLKLLKKHLRAHNRRKCQSKIMKNQNKSAENEKFNVTRKTELLKKNENITPPKKQKSNKNNKLKNSNADLFFCDQCSYSTNQKSLLRGHKHKHSIEKPHQCLECGLCFKRRYHLTRHSLSHKEDAPKYVCPHCPYSTFRKHRLKVHIQTHQTHKAIKCSLCPYSCKYEWTLKFHMRKHTGNKAPAISGVPAKIDFTCHLCGYRCQNTKNMKYHMKRHENKTPHSCPHCDYKCSSKSSLKDHILQHKGLNPYLCSDCGKAFRNASRLTRHKLVHLDVKPHTCDVCNFSTRSKYNLRQHMLRHSNSEVSISKQNNITKSLDDSVVPTQNVLQKVGSQDTPIVTTESIYSDNDQTSPQKTLSKATESDIFATCYDSSVTLSDNRLSDYILGHDACEKTLSQELSTQSNLAADNDKELCNSNRQEQPQKNVVPSNDKIQDLCSLSSNSITSSMKNVNSSLGISGEFSSMDNHSTLEYQNNIQNSASLSTSCDKSWSYNYTNPYFYKETVFPSYVHSNMNFYDGQTNVYAEQFISEQELGHSINEDANVVTGLPDVEIINHGKDLNLSIPNFENESVFSYSKHKSLLDSNEQVERLESNLLSDEALSSKTSFIYLNEMTKPDSGPLVEDNSFKDRCYEENTGNNESFHDFDGHTGIDDTLQLHANIPVVKSLNSSIEVEENNNQQSAETHLNLNKNYTEAFHSKSVENESPVSAQIAKPPVLLLDSNITQSSPFFCLACGQMFDKRSTLAKHRREMHNIEKPHVCEQCGKAFRRKDHLRAHIETHSTDKPFKV